MNSRKLKRRIDAGYIHSPGLQQLDTSSAQFFTSGPTPTIETAEYRWVRTGKVVDAFFLLTFDQLNNGFSYLTIDFPSDMPLPAEWSGLEADDGLYQGVVMVGDYDTIGYATTGREVFQLARSNTSPNGYYLWVYNEGGEATNKDRLWMHVRYAID